MSRRENSGKKDGKITIMISSGLNAHMLNRGEQIRGLHVKDQCDITEVIQAWKMRRTAVYPWNVSVTRTLMSLLSPQGPEQYVGHRRCIISTC